MDKGHSDAVIFLDLKKAFDTVDHNILLQKLASYGVPADEFQFFKSYLTDRTQCCSVNTKMSSFSKVTCVVPQGSILGPLLFIICVNDLAIVAFNSKIPLCANDTALSSRLSKPSELNEKLVPDFMRICEWLKANKLNLNIIKTEYMIIGAAQNLIQLGKIPGINIDGTAYKVHGNHY